jgi:hypothetical protein
MIATTIFLLAPVSLNQVAKADFKVVREVVIAPKGGRTEGPANQKIHLIGPVALRIFQLIEAIIKDPFQVSENLSL